MFTPLFLVMNDEFSLAFWHFFGIFQSYIARAQDARSIKILELFVLNFLILGKQFFRLCYIQGELCHEQGEKYKI